MVKGLPGTNIVLNSKKKTVYHHETHQYMPINTDSELANMVLANEQHMICKK